MSNNHDDKILEDVNAKEEFEDVTTDDVADGQEIDPTAEDLESMDDKLIENSEDANSIEIELAECKDKLLRLSAEFDNFRKRTKKEKEEIYQYASSGLISSVLPVIDNFERALTAIEDVSNPFYKGFEMIYLSLTEALKNEGLSEIDCKGKEFDPNFHNAVATVDCEDIESNCVVEVLQKGYTYKEKVIRHSIVKVSN